MRAFSFRSIDYSDVMQRYVACYGLLYVISQGEARLIYNLRMWNIFRKSGVGLVLGGGGARGFFHVGVIKALQELHIPVSEITGTSIGAIVGAMWASDPKMDIEKKAKEVRLFDVVRTIRESKNNNISEIQKYFQTFVPAERFEDLLIKLTINATDINNREEVIFNTGDLYPGLIASAAVPGVFNPVEYKGHYLLDGGLINNLPVSLITCASRILISDIGGLVKKIDNKSRAIDVLYSSMVLMQQIRSLNALKTIKNKDVVYFNLEDSGVSLLDFRKKNFQKLIDAGYQAVMAKKEIIL